MIKFWLDDLGDMLEELIFFFSEHNYTLDKLKSISVNG